MGASIRLFALLPALLVSQIGEAQVDWRRQVIYLTVLDRFANGNSGNDRAHGHADCNDPNDRHAYQGGDLEGLSQRLDYIRDLGATTVWLTPLYQGVPAKQGANCGFPGYWADFKFPYSLDLDPRFGQEYEFDQLIGRAHDRNLRVILDMVVNHAGYHAKLTRDRPEWFMDPIHCSKQGPPEIYCPLAGLPDFDHRRRDVRDYLIDVHQQWLRRFDFDGIRIDTVKHVEPNYFAEWIARMRDERPSLYVVGEILDEKYLESFDPYVRTGFDGFFNFPLRSSLIETFAKGNSVDHVADKIAATIRHFGEYRASYMVNLLDNHDVPRFTESIPAEISRQSANARYMLALSALMTLPGIPKIYYGNEIGMYGGKDPDNRRFMPDWAFSASGRSRNYSGFLEDPAKIFGHLRHLLAIRSSHPALQAGSYTELWRQNGWQNANVWSFLRSSKEANSQVIVAINNGNRPPDHPLPIEVGLYFKDGTIFDEVLGQSKTSSIKVANGRLNLWLEGQSAVILVPRGSR